MTRLTTMKAFGIGWILVWGFIYIDGVWQMLGCTNGCQTDQGLELILLQPLGWIFTVGLLFMAPLSIVHNSQLTPLAKTVRILGLVTVLAGFGLWPWPLALVAR
jgi:hypothetical protein